MPHFHAQLSTEDGVILRQSDDMAVSSSHETARAREARIKIKTRRRRYLEMHPEYFKQSSLELADPLLYDRMVRHFQTTVERETEGRQKGYSGTLEADLLRSEAKIEALNHPDPNSPLIYRRDATGSIAAVDQDEEDRPKSREQGFAKWKECMEQRFLSGKDVDVDYDSIDHDDRYDDWQEDSRRREEKYFEDEDAEFVAGGEQLGETGIQDY